MSQLSTFLSPQSRKAWVAGVIAFLGPVYDLISGDAVLNWRVVLLALLAGLVATSAVFGTGNTDPPVSNPPAPEPLVGPDSSFTGQTVTGE